MEVKGQSISYRSRLKKQRENCITEHKRQIEDNLTDTDLHDFDKLRHCLDKIQYNKLEGVLFVSKLQWIIEEEKTDRILL